MRASVTVHIDAPPERVWDLISDITRMGEYSPEVVEAEWLDGAEGPSVGARYRGHVKRNERWPVLYWTTCEITECQRGEVFEFAVVMGGRSVNVWRYEFRGTDDGGTAATESFDLGDNILTKVWYPLGGFLRQRRNERDMRRTLERVKAVAEAP
ncbi:MAG TPA: SRPBCC family protein [Mycobacteriales bacterium]|nr:SRPBCC family protein [Mycobacteriales bacterium]